MFESIGIAIASIIAIIIALIAVISGKADRPSSKSGGNSLPILFIPGLGNGAESFAWDTAPDELVEKLKIPRHDGIATRLSKDFRVINVDPPGLTSGSPPESLDQYCEYLYSLVGGKTNIIAHSMGCIIAMRYRELYPVGKMIFIDPTPTFIQIEARNPDWYKKRGGKYDIVRAYIPLFTHYEQSGKMSDVYVVANLEDIDPRKEEYKEFIESRYSNYQFVHNKSHFIHLKDPDLIYDLAVKVF